MAKRKVNIVFILILVGALFLIVTNQEIFPFAIDSEMSGDAGEVEDIVPGGGISGSDVLGLVVIITLFLLIRGRKKKR